MRSRRIGSKAFALSQSFPWYADRGFLRIINPFMIPILRSPFHGLASRDTMLITFTGRKSGKQYTIPVSYIREENIITFLTPRSWSWWKNLRGNVEVTVHVKGRALRGRAEIVEDQEIFVERLNVVLKKVPRDNLAYKISRDFQGQFSREELLFAVQKYVMFQIQVG
jgi:deazaflavin-dependent oxidoreductase (nitroreductase family)